MTLLYDLLSIGLMIPARAAAVMMEGVSESSRHQVYSRRPLILSLTSVTGHFHIMIGRITSDEGKAKPEGVKEGAYVADKRFQSSPTTSIDRHKSGRLGGDQLGKQIKRRVYYDPREFPSHWNAPTLLTSLTTLHGSSIWAASLGGNALYNGKRK